MLEILRKSPVLRLSGNKTLALKNIRPAAKTLWLSAEALVDATAHGQAPTLAGAFQEASEKSGNALPLSAKLVALAFGPENGAVSESLVYNAAKEAYATSYVDWERTFTCPTKCALRRTSADFTSPPPD